MPVLEAAFWGLAGGAAAGLLSLSASVAAAQFQWPWRQTGDGVWPYLFVIGVGLLVGAIVAGAAHSQMSGAPPESVRVAGVRGGEDLGRAVHHPVHDQGEAAAGRNPVLVRGRQRDPGNLYV